MTVLDAEPLVTRKQSRRREGMLGDADSGRRAIALMTAALTGEPEVMGLLRECRSPDDVQSLLLVALRLSAPVDRREQVALLAALALEHEATVIDRG